jgi:hypothetical protein
MTNFKVILIAYCFVAFVFELLESVTVLLELFLERVYLEESVWLIGGIIYIVISDGGSLRCVLLVRLYLHDTNDCTWEESVDEFNWLTHELSYHHSSHILFHNNWMDYLISILTTLL